MDNITDLISTSDFLILFIYTLLALFFLRSFVYKNMDKKFKKLLTVFIVLKLICAVMMSLLLIFYWQTSDNINFFNESKNLFTLIKADIANLKYFFQPVMNYNERIQFDNDMIATPSSQGIESNFLMAKITTILYPLALGRYMVVNFLFSLIAAIGQLKFYIALSNRYPHIKKGIAIAVLLMPSVLLYSSYMNKETLCAGFIGFAVYSYFKIMAKKNRGLFFILLMINLYLIAVLKMYIVAAFLAAVLLVYFIKMLLHFFRGPIFAKVFIIIALAAASLVLVVNLSYFDHFIVDFAKTSNTFQEQYNANAETSSFEFGEVETSFAGLVKKAPLGIFTTYFRPQLWEVNKPIILFSALESFATFILMLWAVVIKRKYIRTLLKNDIFINVSFFYVLIFGVIVGLTTFNFGTLVRYKIPGVPFLMLFIFLLLSYKPEKTALLKT